MPSSFDMVFKRGKQFDEVKLSNRCPCEQCRLIKNVYEKERLYFPQSDYYTQEIDDEIEYIKKEHCDKCMEYMTWKMDCFAKLEEYEKICVSTAKMRTALKCK